MARIEHFAIFASDLAALRSFYEEAFGLRVVLDNSRAPTPGYFLTDDHGCVLEIIGRPPNELPVNQRFVCHIAFWVDDYSAARRDLITRGIQFEPDTAIETDQVRTAFFLDPQGNRAQIVWRKQPLGS